MINYPSVQIKPARLKIMRQLIGHNFDHFYQNNVTEVNTSENSPTFI